MTIMQDSTSNPHEPESDRLHNLSRDTNGRWVARFTVYQGSKVVGKPIRIKLGKITEAQAIRRRGQHIRALKDAGVTVKIRKQRRFKKL